jgi:hypothetical protein
MENSQLVASNIPDEKSTHSKLLQDKIIDNLNNFTNKELILKISTELTESLREYIFNYYDNQNFNQTLKTGLIDIIKLMLELTNSENPSLTNELMEKMEFFMFLFLFHFDIDLNYISFYILNSILIISDPNYHRETLQNFIKIIQILKVKKTVNNVVCTKIITNLSNGLVIILYNTTSEVRKCFYDLLKTNSQDPILPYILCNGTSEDLNFSKMFSNEMISDLLEKFSKEFEKHLKLLEGFLSKNDKTLTSKTRIKQSIDIINCICKTMDSFAIRGNKSYIMDKIMKNLTPIIKRFWNLILFNSDIYVSLIYFIFLGN